ncbi:MAG: TRAP transporter substrate-binding protein DctP [Thermodesulfobacteriota bacterium]
MRSFGCLRRLVAVVVLGLFWMVPCGLAAEKETWKAATMAPQDAGWGKHYQDLVLPMLQEMAPGELGVTIFWNGVRGDDTVVVRKLKSGELQAAGLSGLGAVEAVPDFAVVELPFLFANYDEVDYVRDKMFPTFGSLAESNGYKLMYWLDQGFDQIYSVTPDIYSLKGINQLYFITWMGPMEELMFNGLETRVYPMSILEMGDLVKEGIGQAVMAPAQFIKANELFKVFKYVNTVKMRYAPGIAVVTLDAYNKLPAPLRKKIEAGRQDLTRRFVAACRAEEQANLRAMIGYGLETVETRPQDLEDLKSKAVTVWKRGIGGLYTEDMLNQVIGYINEYRAAKKSGKLIETVALGVKTAAPAGPGAFAVTTDVIRKVQEKLKAQGYYDMGVDGILGIRTFLGIKKYQKDKGMTETGAIDQKLLNSLGIK